MNGFTASLLLLLTLSAPAKAQTAAEVFVNMPDSHIPQLEDAWRKDLLDLHNAGREARLQNTMGGFSTLIALTEDYALLQSTENTTVELKLLPLVNNTKIVCLITTVNAPVSDSRLAFYTTEWQPIEAATIFTPVESDWFIREDADRDSFDFNDFVARLDIELIHYTLSADDNTLTATYTTPLYLGANYQAKSGKYIKDVPKLYSWVHSHFR